MTTCYVLAGCIMLSLYVWAYSHYRKKRLPPGPGRMGSNEHPWQTYARWSYEFGSLVTVNRTGRPVVVINTVKAVLDLLEKRSHFSCRPRWPMAELLGRQNNIGFQYYGERLRKSRKVLHGALSQSALHTTWSHFLNDQSIYLLQKFMLAPNDMYTDVLESVEELIVRFTYGRDPHSQYRELAKEVMHQTGIALQPGRWMVNLFPVLAYVPAWVPGAEFKRWAHNAREAFLELTRTPFMLVKSEMEALKAPPSFVRNALMNSNSSAEEEDIILSAAGSLYSAGTDTISGAILTFFLLMTREPAVQSQAFAEIVAVIGTDRLPNLQDRAALPYLDCIIQEVFRFNPPIPLVTHSNTREDEYEGCWIPPKTWIMANVWAMLHNEEEYSDHQRFMPERFLRRDGLKPPRDPRTLIYGFGRRICPGAHFANDFIYLVVSRAIACYEICAEEKDGCTLYPPLEFITGLVPTPKPFRFHVKSRGGAIALLHSGLSVDGILE